MGTGRIRGHVGTRAAEARLLAMADRLFSEYDQLPVRTVFQAIGAARMELREQNGGVVTAEDIERLARRRLEAAPRAAPGPAAARGDPPSRPRLPR